MLLKNDTTESQCRMILQHLQSGLSITADEAGERFGCRRLASRINDLKNRGFQIEKEMIRATNRYGKPVRFARYFLKKQKQHEATL